MVNIVNSSIKNGILVISVTGRVDSTNSAEMEKEISAIVDTASYQLPVLDLSDLEYISSAGLRVLMKLRKQYGRPLTDTDRDLFRAELVGKKLTKLKE